MSADINEIKETVKTFVKMRFLKNAEDKELTYSTTLISGGLIDSILTMQLVVFLEQTYHFEFQAHEVDKDNLDTIDIISAFVVKKLNG
ncbi:MAG: acyl carrier protein [Bacteroidetes bacterium]|nr:acyl carrier protein [Bacteroidota bacterium]